MAKPKIRFNGYTEDWEQRKLNEVAEKICVGFVGTCEKFYTDESGVPMYRTGNLNGLSLNRDDLKYVTNEFHQHNQKSQLKAGDILIARHGDSGKAVNYESSEEANCLNIVIIRPDFKKCNYKFLTNCINSPECQKHIKSLSAGSTQAVINTSEIEKLGVVMPANIDEQNRIARYFSNLDHLITLHQRKCEQTKTLKKYMLQKMFPQDGEKVPQIRFEGFTEDWEQRKLEDFGKATGGTSIESEFTEDGIYKVISIGSYSENSVYNDQGIRAIKSDKTNNRVLNRNDLTMILNDKTTSGNIIGRVLLIEESGIYVYNQRTERIEINLDEYDPVFLYEMLNAPNIREKIIKQAQGNTQIYVNWTAISLLEYMIPSKEEQVKIGEYLHSIDNLITLHQRKCDELKEVKKFMLQNMFV